MHGIVDLKLGIAGSLPEGVLLFPVAEDWVGIRNDLSQYFEAQAIGLVFEKTFDGRAYSVAAWLRESGYGGILYALGPISGEQLYFLRRSGFDFTQISNDWLSEDGGLRESLRTSLIPFAAHYQTAADGRPGLIGFGPTSIQSTSEGHNV